MTDVPDEPTDEPVVTVPDDEYDAEEYVGEPLKDDQEDE